MLGLKDVSKAIHPLDGTEKGKNRIPTLGGIQALLCISESGLYKLIMRSDKQQAKGFQDWVTKEVLPSIRKTGAYVKGQPSLHPTIQALGEHQTPHSLRRFEALDVA